MAPDALTQERVLGELVRFPLATELGQRFEAAGHELYLVGGTVRDRLLQRPVADLDFATSARPEETERLLRGWADRIWLTGARFGTVSARKNSVAPPWQLEITTFRSDAYQPGSRHPEVSYGGDIATDLSRRDFTLNAMAVRVPQQRFVDPFGGLADLNRRLLRTPVEPATSFGDDPLRMVRLARFAAVLEAEVDPPAVAAVTAMPQALDSVSRERIRDELDKLLAGADPARGLDLLCDTGLADRFLPELPALRMQRDPSHHHKDVYRHTIAVVAGVPADDRVLRLAALLHDVGKPATRAFHGGGKVSFHHHEVVGARMARARLTELRYPGETVEAVAELVFLHLRFHGYAAGEWTDAAVRRYARDAGDARQLARLNLLTRADVTTRNVVKAQRLAAAMDDLEQRIERLAQEEQLDRLRPPLDGHEIMAHLGLAPGPLVGEAWRMLLDARIDRGPLTREEGLALLDGWAAERDLD